MRGLSINSHGRQIVITGVEGAGRKFFASLYFPAERPAENSIRLSAKAKEVIVVVVLDCCHLQNLAEADVLKDVAATIKRWKSKPIRMLLVLGRIDLVCTRHQNRKWLESVMREYKPYLKKIKARERVIVAHSNLAVQRMRQAIDDEVEADDVDDLSYLLSKTGHRLPKSVSVNNAKKYIGSHLKSLQMLTGEYYVNQFLTKTVRVRTPKEK